MRKCLVFFLPVVEVAHRTEFLYSILDHVIRNGFKGTRNEHSRWRLTSSLWLSKHVKENRSSASTYLLRYSLLITSIYLGQ